MAQRWRAAQRIGTSLLGVSHQAEHQAALGSARPLLSLLTQEQQQQHGCGGGAWQQAWTGGTGGGVRHASWFSKRPATPPAAAAPSADEPAAPEAPALDLDPASPPEFFPLPESSATEVVAAIHQATAALERASVMGAKADSFFSAAWCIDGLTMVHDSMGTPWWLSIAIFNITLRCVTFPLMVVAQKGSAKMMAFNYNLLHAKKLQEAAMKATSQEEHNRLFNAFRQEYTAQVSRHGDPVKTALMVPGVMLLNGGIFLSIFNGVSTLMAAKPPSLTVGGAAWFPDLTVADPYFGLPLMCTAVTLAMVEYGMNLGGDVGPMPMERQAATKGIKWLLRGLAFMFIPAGSYVAAGTAVLWVSNTAFGVVQGLLLRNNAFRRRVQLPTMEELREMNRKVMEANAASAPAAPQGAPGVAAAAGGPGPALTTPLLTNKPLGRK